ncbi:MAG: hypothetical protein PHQ11_00565 [Paludibacter sp.]|nr:hypothetical protein [Paludibacter sp.]
MKTEMMIFVSCLLIIGSVGCKDESYIPPSDPEQAILGKWELIESRN